MGLDMNLYKMPKIKKYEFNELMKIREEIEDRYEDFIKKEIYEDFKPYIKQVGNFIHWNDIAEEICYWRKANQIHNWFVENVQSRC